MLARTPWAWGELTRSSPDLKTRRARPTRVVLPWRGVANREGIAGCDRRAAQLARWRSCGIDLPSLMDNETHQPPSGRALARRRTQCHRQ